MFKKKIALYVEGLTEQILVNHLILTWWSYENIRIENIKLLADQNSPSPVSNFIPNSEIQPEFFFLITDVAGVGSLASAIASRADQQQQNGFEIIGLRDLYEEDYRKVNFPSLEAATEYLCNNFKMALQIKNCKKPEKIELFFAIMEIEAWILPFTTALSKWASIPEDVILQTIKKKNSNIELIKNPSTLIEKMKKSNSKRKSKSFGETAAIVRNITFDDLQNIYTSRRVPGFSRFWNRLIS